MHTQDAPSSEAQARVLAAMVAANGRVDEREMHALDGLDAFRRIGISRERFVELAHACLKDLGAGFGAGPLLRASELQYLNRILDRVSEPSQRLLVCRLAAAVITADGRVTPDERLTYEYALGYWCISQALVSQAILKNAPAAPPGVSVKWI